MQNTPLTPDAADTNTSTQKEVASQQAGSVSRSAHNMWGCEDDIEDEEEDIDTEVVVANGKCYGHINRHGHNASSIAIHQTDFGGTIAADAKSTLSSDGFAASALIPPLLLGDNDTVSDDSRPVSSSEDYDHIAREAHSHWRSRLKQPAEALEQSASDIRDFTLGSSRRRLRLVLIQLYSLLEKTPRIYELLEYKQSLKGHSSSQIWLERKLNSLWSELKVKCSLLILDKESRAWSTIDQAAIPDVDVCDDKASFVQSHVQSILEEVVGSCSVLWDCFDDSIRGLVLINSGKEIIRSIFLAANDSHGLHKRILRSLLGSFSVLPDLYKAVIKGTVETIASASISGFRLVASELQRHRVLPGVLFRAIASYTKSTLEVDEIVQRLDDLFCTSGSYLWIDPPASRTRSKYAQPGIELYERVCSHFFAQGNTGNDNKQRQAPQFMRVVSGLIGFLRLEANEAFLDAFKRTECFALEPSTADISASLLLVLVGCGSQIPANDILNAVSGITNPLVAARIDSLIAHLLTDHVKPVAEFVNKSLGMDFAYPHERLFYFKDAVLQSKLSHFSGAAIAKRLISKDYAKTEDTSPCCSHLQSTAILYFLQAEVFQENGIDIREWFSALIGDMDAAVADGFSVVVKAYVSAIFSSSAITPIPETALWTLFSPANVFSIATSDSVSPAQVLCLLYLLYYCENLAEQSKGLSSQFSALGNNRPLLNNSSVSGTQLRASSFGASMGTASNRSTGFSSQSMHTASTGGSSPPIGIFGAVKRGEYSDQLLDSLPVSWILRRVSRSPAYRLVWPVLLSMATAQFPDQLDAVAVLQHELSVDALQQTSYKSLASEPHIPRKCPPPFQLVETFLKLKSEAHGLFKHATTDLPGERTRDEQLMLLLSTIEQYFKYPVPVRMETCGAFSGYLCRIALQNCADDEIVASICQAWFSLHELNPHIVSTATANSWRTKVETAKPKLAPQDMWLDPLVLFRSDSRVFESPGLTDILLTVLAEFLVLSRTCMYRIHSLRQRDNCAVKRPHVVALVQLQESSALQILIELASLSRNDAVRALIFEFIHARFLEQRVVQKLVHFQAYGLAAIDDMVKNVPSMHACSEFIPEMLMQSTPRLQLFSVKLAASITANYPIAANEGMTKEVILPHIQTTLTQIAGTVAADQLAISNAMLEAVIRINHAFPLIRQDCTRLIQAVQNAAIEKVQTVFQDTQQQSDLVQNTAKWVGSCDKVLKVIDNANTEEDRLHFTQIEDISPDDFVSMVESAMKPREKNKHFGSKPPTSSSAEPGSTTAHQQGVATSILPPVGLPTHPPPGQTLTPFNTSLPNPQQPHGSGSGPIPGNQKRSHGTAMDSPAEFGRGRGGPFVNTGGALRGPPPSATGQQLPDLAGQGNAVMYAHLQPAQMAAGALGTHGPAGFKKRPRQRSRPPGGKDMNGGKAAAIGMKRSAKVPGGDRQQRTKDH